MAYAVLATLVTCTCQSAEPAKSSQALIIVAVFEAMADAPAAIVKAMPSDLATVLDAHPAFEAQTHGERSEPPAAYLLNGQVYAEGQRAFVALQLLDAKTSKVIWFENYDYRGISAEMMARDILRYLEANALSMER
jgi:hypothetical protein